MDKIYNFIDLFNEKVDFKKGEKVSIEQIVIPKIQRPYAQGRSDEACTYIRQTFLTEIFNALQNEEALELNFIYGIVRPQNDKYVMELLDGQQRMTTLFLLHWYIANRELKAGDEKDVVIRNCLRRFVYETRSTSSVFCLKLASFHVDLTNKTPKEAIRSARWYFKSFDRDSTITAMLTMLDAMHEEYNKISEPNIIGSLGKLQFYVKSLGCFNLSEELYIKMNARGLQLSAFENFKADLTNFVTQQPYDGYTREVQLFNNNSETVPFYLNFSTKLDAKWIDIFWNGSEPNFDASYLLFFYRYFACKYIINSKNEVSDNDIRSDKNIKELYTKADGHVVNNEYQGFNIFKKILLDHPEYIENLDLVLDVFCERHKDIISHAFVPTWDQAIACRDDFYCNSSTRMTQTKLILFSAVVEYIEAYKEFDKDTFARWMRVVWNVIENTNIDSLTPTASLIRKFANIIHFIAKYKSEEFYSALVRWHNECSDENENRAVEEEVKKARRIAEDNEWEEIFMNAENHPFFKGMVLFFYSNGMSKEDYLHRYYHARQMFDVNGISAEYRKEHLLIRAIVSNFNSWDNDNLKERYITERAEKDKYLKNVIAAHSGVRKMIGYALDGNDTIEVKRRLKGYIEKTVKFGYWENASTKEKEMTDMAFHKLRTDVGLYDWIAYTENSTNACFRVYWFEGHIMFAIPKRRFAKIALDTDRAIMASMLVDEYGFAFYDKEQEEYFHVFGNCNKNEVWVKQERKQVTIWVGFCLGHRMSFQITCANMAIAQVFMNKIPGSKILDTFNISIEIPSLETHYSIENSYKQISKEVEKVLHIVDSTIKKNPQK